MSYEAGDKVVVKIDSYDAKVINEEGGYSEIHDNQILGKLEDFQPKEEKIKFTPEMKKEFDEIKNKRSSLTCRGLLDYLDDHQLKYPALYLFMSPGKDAVLHQLNICKAWYNPSLIEVTEPERHEVDINGSRLCKFGKTWSFDKMIFAKITLNDVKEAEKQLGIQGLQAKWHEASEKDE